LRAEVDEHTPRWLDVFREGFEQITTAARGRSRVYVLPSNLRRELSFLAGLDLGNGHLEDWMTPEVKSIRMRPQ
jgi:hypothetical protein